MPKYSLILLIGALLLSASVFASTPNTVTLDVKKPVLGTVERESVYFENFLDTTLDGNVGIEIYGLILRRNIRNDIKIGDAQTECFDGKSPKNRRSYCFLFYMILNFERR